MSLDSASDSLEINRSKLCLTQRKGSLTGENKDVMLSKGQTPDSGCFDDIDDCEGVSLNENSAEQLTTKTDEHMRNLARAIEAISLESITSGISSGSSASEDRLDLLRCVTSYSNVGSRPPADTACHSKRRVRSATVSKSSADYKSFVKKRCSFSCDSVPALDKFRNQQRRKSVTAVSTENGANYNDSCENVNSCNSNAENPSRQQSVTIASEDSNEVKRCTSNKELRRTDSKYDPTLEKSKTFLHGQGKTFSRANEYLTPARPGLQKIQVSYTQTNTENNYRKIFYDLVKTAHRQNIIVSESVKNLERRLFFRRSDPHRATSYFEHKGLRDPSRSHRKKMARTTADKIKERKEKIKQTSDEIKIGYIPREHTIVLPGPEDIERLRSCRYLRVNSKIPDI
ncbi:uncharacterized protein LOC110467106 [Mizuhopecten yessoensis]|uniref:Uncharacterized protein n=1 Tax=Mizuhopecten yessoensis TaxID=6573 RepID=A0A210PML7_MIZYE|nr:uncharacterized protein LOC110467106 [Mizuhopecten yessoensis]OWF37732.1 hypothetical protein KP79_PYT09974 [Mizuhopecten yessoensis]